MAPVSTAEWGRRALMTPIVIPTMTAKVSAARDSSMVTGSACRISQITGWRVRMESPKSPRRASPRKRRYWMYMG